MRKFKVIILSFIVLLIIVPLFVFAKTNENVFIGADEIINSNFYKAGNSVVIEGTINGDVFVAGNMVVIKGVISGNVFAVGSSIDISGDIGGSVFTAGSNITISSDIDGALMAGGSNVILRSKVAKNAYVFGANTSIADSASVGMDLTSGGASLSVAGNIARNAVVFASNATIGSQVGNDVIVRIDEKEGKLTILPAANILGNLTYKGYGADQLVIKAGAVIEGKTNFEEIKAMAHSDEKSSKKYFTSLVTFAKLVWLFSIIIIGLVLTTLIPKPIKQISETMIKKPAVSLGWGVIYLIVTPVIAFLLMITLIGAPLGLIVVAGYFISLYVVQVIVSIVIGAWIISKIKKEKEPNLIWSLVIGTIVFVIIASIPFIGWALKLLVVIWALGAGLTVKKKMLKEMR